MMRWLEHTVQQSIRQSPHEFPISRMTQSDRCCALSGSVSHCHCPKRFPTAPNPYQEWHDLLRNTPPLQRCTSSTCQARFCGDIHGTAWKEFAATRPSMHPAVLELTGKFSPGSWTWGGERTRNLQEPNLASRVGGWRRACQSQSSWWQLHLPCVQVHCHAASDRSCPSRWPGVSFWWPPANVRESRSKLWHWQSFWGAETQGEQFLDCRRTLPSLFFWPVWNGEPSWDGGHSCRPTGGFVVSAPVPGC